jgi:hypothetical protein
VVDEFRNRTRLGLRHSQTFEAKERLVLLKILPISAQSLGAAGLSGQVGKKTVDVHFGLSWIGDRNATVAVVHLFQFGRR